MFRKLKIIGQLLFLQLTAKSQSLPFDQITFSNPLKTDADSIIHEQVKVFFKKAKAPGLIIGISQNGEKKFYCYGFADSARKQPFTAKTIFEIGSITKTFTANLLFQLHEQKIVNINSSITKYLPAQFKNDSVLQKITLANLASQTSDLPRLPDNLDKIKEYTLMQPYQFYKREHLYSFLKGIRKNNPGSYAYSNLGFGLLSTIEEDVTAMSFESLLNNTIFQPLQMDDTYIEAKKKSADSAAGYFYGKPADYWLFDCLAGAGAIKSTAADLLKYLVAHIEYKNENFSVVASKVTQPVKPVSTNMQICYGWHTLEDLKHRVFWHNGGTYGFSTFAAFEPNTKTSIVLAANATGDNAALDKLAVDLLILLMGK
ncbi:MAG: beta-lactamase family protein [Chitinophagaceae bacterium]|nr:beta-lactamase family protein [Chitinophagaceae bacterium]